MEDQTISEEPPKQDEDEEESDTEEKQITIEGEHEAVSEKDKIIAEIMEVLEEGKEIRQENSQLQHKLSIYTQEAIMQEKFNAANLPADSNEETFKKILENIDRKQKEIEEHKQKANEKLESINSEINQREDQWKQLNEAFRASKERTAMSAVNSENGSQYTREEVEELLRKEEKARTILEQYQLEAIKSNYNVQSITKKKKNLAIGFLDYGEYEVMCTSTDNNNEVIKHLKEEIEDFTQRSSKAVNVLSHLIQKLQDSQRLTGQAELKEKHMEEELNEMKEKLFKEKLEYTKMREKNEDMHHKNILLQYPRLLDDYNNVLAENEEAKKEIERLKEVYFHTKKIMSQMTKR